VRKLAWLHAVPEGGKKSRLTTYREVDEDSFFLKLPEIDEAGYLISLLQEAGLMSSAGMGALPLSWQEIEAWLRTTERDISIWERLMIRELSEVYVGELNQASAKDRAAPYTHVEEDEVKIDREAVASKLLSALRSMKRNQQAPKEDSTEK